MKEYALYKGEEILAIGTLKEIAKQTNVKPESILHYGTPTYAKRTDEKKGRRLIRIN